MEEKWEEFDEAIKPLRDWLCKHGDPHTKVIVDLFYARIVEDACGIPLSPPD